MNSRVVMGGKQKSLRSKHRIFMVEASCSLLKNHRCSAMSLLPNITSFHHGFCRWNPQDAPGKVAMVRCFLVKTRRRKAWRRTEVTPRGSAMLALPRSFDVWVLEEWNINGTYAWNISTRFNKTVILELNMSCHIDGIQERTFLVWLLVPFKANIRPAIPRTCTRTDRLRTFNAVQSSKVLLLNLRLSGHRRTLHLQACLPRGSNKA